MKQRVSCDLDIGAEGDGQQWEAIADSHDGCDDGGVMMTSGDAGGCKGDVQ